MGVTAIFKCRKCGHEFRADHGGAEFFSLFRCADCDTTKRVSSESDHDDTLHCHQCGGKLRYDLGPMCQKCKSRDVEETKVLGYYD